MLEEVAKLTPPHEATLRTASGVLFGEDQRYWWDVLAVFFGDLVNRRNGRPL